MGEVREERISPTRQRRSKKPRWGVGRKIHFRDIRVGAGGVGSEGTLDGEAEDEASTAVAADVLGDDVAGVLAQDLAADRQPQARAARALGALEWLEQVQ